MWGKNQYCRIDIQLFMTNAKEFNDKNPVLFDNNNNNKSEERCPLPTQRLTASVGTPNVNV